MGKYVDQAVNYHKNYNFCSSSVLMAFKDVIGITESEANTIAAPMGSGRMNVCGAILAAEEVLKRLDREDDAKVLRQKFIDKNGGYLCNDIRRNRLQTCRGCVIDASTLLEEML